MDSDKNPNILDTPVLDVGPSVVSELIGTNRRAFAQNFHVNKLENQVAPQCYFNVETEHFLDVPMARSEPQTRITDHVEGNSMTRISTTAVRDKPPDVIEKFDKYWGNINTLNPLLFIAVALDPRYKLKYLNFCFSRIYDKEEAKCFGQKVKEGLTSLFECYVKFAANSSCAEKNSQLHFAINVEEYEDDSCNLLAAQFAIHLEEIESRESNMEL